MSDNPATDGQTADGRDPTTGKFLPGNSCSRKGGSPYIRQIAALRSKLYEACTPDEMAEVVQALLKKAKQGNVPAAKLLFERCLGPAIAADVLEEIEQLKAAIGAIEGERGP